MILYDIHTHKLEEEISNDYTVKSILSTSPSQYNNLEKSNLERCYSCGVHPWSADNADLEIESLYKIVKNKNIVAVGEVGLDKFKGPDLKIQQETFRKQIEIAIEINIPLIIHCVKAWDELIALYKEYKSDIPWIIHGYRGNPEQTKQLSKLGFMFSIGEKFNAESLKFIPDNSMFCETDISDVSICHVYQAISADMEVDFEQFVYKIADNAQNIFK